MAGQRQRRKISNYLIGSGPQIRLLMPMLGLMCLGIAAIAFLYFQFVEIMENMGSSDPELHTLLEIALRNFTMACCGAMVILGISCLVFWIISSHRIFGPIVPIRRQIDHLLANRFQERIYLRKSDEFVDLAEKLNELAAKLQEKAGQP